jgi:hypothetical protein
MDFQEALAWFWGGCAVIALLSFLAARWRGL